METTSNSSLWVRARARAFSIVAASLLMALGATTWQRAEAQAQAAAKAKSQAQDPSTQATPGNNATSKHRNDKLRKEIPPTPPQGRDTSDTADQRRNLFSI